MEPEFLAHAPSADCAEDVLDTGGRHRGASRVARWLAEHPLLPVISVAVLILAVVGVVATGTAGGRPGPAAASAASRPSPVSQQQSQLMLVRSWVHAAAGDTDFIRSSAGRGDCPVVRAGSAPAARDARRLLAALAGYRVCGTSRIIDQFGQMCVLQVRATDAAGTMEALRVAAPARPAVLRTGDTAVHTSSNGRRSIGYVRAVGAGHWAVTIGYLGPVRDQPPTNDLVCLAQDRSLCW